MTQAKTPQTAKEHSARFLNWQEPTNIEHEPPEPELWNEERLKAILSGVILINQLKLKVKD